MARPIKQLQADAETTKELQRRARAATSSVRDRERADIVLLRLQGLKVEAVAEQLGTTAKRVSMWGKRFEAHGLAGLDDKKGRGRKPSLSDAKVARVVTEATRPPKGKSRWSIRTMAKHTGVSATSVQRIWSKNELKPHIVKTFKLSNDSKFEEKFWDVIGLYLQPPVNALVLCCDEKSQCQALERTQLSLPLAPRYPRTMTHDYKRHGTITLFAALIAVTGKLITRTDTRHTHVEWPPFSQTDRQRNSGRCRSASDRRQLRDPQTSERARMAREASALQDAFHADIVIVDEPRRALLRRPHRRRDPLGQLRLGR